MKKSLFIILLIAILVSGCSQTTVRQNPKFAETWSKQYSVVALPPEVIITYLQFNGDNSRLKEQEDELANAIKK